MSVLIISIIGTIVSVYICLKRGHNGLAARALALWPLALFISLCIPVKES